jgi:uncharacterized membrane protein
MSPTAMILLLWIAFAATHMGLASVRLRPRLTERLGERGYQGLYSLIALAIFIPLVSIYFGHKHFGPWLWVLPRSEILLWIVYVLNGIALVLLTASFVTPSPAAMGPGKGEARGALLITRHPTFMAIAIWAGSHLVFNSARSDLAFFGGMVVFSLLGAWHQDRRKLEAGPAEFPSFYAATPFFPFTGSRTLDGLRGLSPVVLVIGVGATVALRWFHSNLFGGGG